LTGARRRGYDAFNGLTIDPMAKLIGSELPAAVFARLRGTDLEAAQQEVILLTTIDEQGWPHPALLSPFEVVAADARNLRLATYGDSRTTGNMRRNGKATLTLVVDRVAYYIKATATELAPAMRCTPHNAKLNCKIEQVLADEANPEYEPGAYIASGLTYYNPGRAAELARAPAILAELLE
jgi:hypothetical protein